MSKNTNTLKNDNGDVTYFDIDEKIINKMDGIIAGGCLMTATNSYHPRF